MQYILTIVESVASVLGVFVSIFAIIITVRQSREEQRISLHEKRKAVYDFFREYIENWLFYRKHATCNGLYPLPLIIAFNGFAKERLDEDPRFNVQLLLAITRGYNDQFDSLNDIHIYFHLNDKEKSLIEDLLDSMKNYYSAILKFYDTCKNDRNNLDSSVEYLENSFTKFYERIREVDDTQILAKLHESILVK